MISRTVLAWAIGVWALLAWGGRILIVFDAGSGVWDRTRIALSLITAAAAVVALWAGRWIKPALLAYAAVAAVVWIRSAVFVMTDDTTPAFVAIHLFLAAVSLGLGVLAVLTARQSQ